MKFNFLRRRLNNFLFAFSVFLLIIGYGLISNFHYSDFSYCQITSRLQPIDPVVSDSLPNYKYRQLTDSIQQTRKMKNGMRTSWSVDPWFTGFLIQKRCDTCKTFFGFFDQKTEMDYLIRLKWWQLDTGARNNPTIYYVKNGQSFLRKGICKLKKVDQNKISEFTCREADVPVPFRYDKEKQNMMIPVTKITLDIVKPIFAVLGIGLSLFYISFMLVSFFKMLLDICKGDPFSEMNLIRLRNLMLGCFLPPIIGFSLNLLLRLVFYNYFTPDIRLSPEAWKGFAEPFAIGIIFATLYIAFKKGKQLKEEHDLTI
ncbi:hypothetical protein ABIE26_004077 [Pedobacter africanus]